ncbi:MAG: hypothetical protein HUK13_06285 [Muribaculaceae bacterium]|nr:hypothetical protein [Muribaculaceae bacterium]
MRLFLKLILQLVLSPTHGWEDVERAMPDVDRMARRGFYPLLTVTALSALIFPQETILLTIVDVIVTFFMFFLGYLIGVFSLAVLLPSVTAGKVPDDRIRTYVMLITGMLAIIWLICNIVPALLPLVWFMPVYIAVVQWKGSIFLDVREDMIGKFVAITILGITFPPYIIRAVLALIFPI